MVFCARVGFNHTFGPGDNPRHYYHLLPLGSQDSRSSIEHFLSFLPRRHTRVLLMIFLLSFFAPAQPTYATHISTAYRQSLIVLDAMALRSSLCF
ncbi:putative voltage-gated potassium channel subunit beta [Fusarium oxysporum f. sp. albedinis]|nr:putative voltage-gated potassium channel subunit beta [Fusarium oxysporum f. sp. albedinis]